MLSFTRRGSTTATIEIVDGRLFVNVPGVNPRRVPVRHPWNRTLLRRLVGRTDPNEYVFRAYRFEEYRPPALGYRRPHDVHYGYQQPALAA